MSKKIKTTTTLVIVESPAKCKKIEEYLGPGYKCVATYGHLRTIQSLKNIEIENNFKPIYTIIDEPIKKKQIEYIRKEIKAANEVILSSDSDREGEAISFSIIELFNLPINTKRITFNEITESALQQAIKNPRTIDMNVVHAQQARQILDVLVGFKVSPVLWKLVSQPKGKDSALSAGRCQTPALKLIYENQQELDNSIEKKVYNTTGYFTNSNIPFELKPEGKFEDEDEMIDFLDESTTFSHIYTCSQPTKVFKQPPEPFTTSRLQQVASNELHYSPKETMRICQTLYEKGYITYMRTDSKMYCNEFIDLVSNYIQNTYDGQYFNVNLKSKDNNDNTPLDQPVKKGKKSEKKETKDRKDRKDSLRQVKDSLRQVKDSLRQEAHEAIRPTNIHVKEIPEDIGNKEKRMYKLIWTNTLESCMTPASFYSVTANITAPKNTKYSFISELIDFPGWKIVENKFSRENKDYQYLQTIKKDLPIAYKKIYSKVTIKGSKSHYTEARLVQLLEERGIGRPSTFSSLVDKIQERGYVKKEDVKGKEVVCRDFELENGEICEDSVKREFGNEKSKLIIQPLGIIVMEFLEKHFDNIFNYDYTSLMEQALDKISKGEIIWHELCSSCNKEVDSLIELVRDETKFEFEIDENNTYLIGKYGPVIKCVEEKEDGKEEITFKSVKKDIDVSKLKNGEYDLEDIIESNKKTNSQYILGQHEGKDLILRKGKFGLYVSWGENSKTLKELGNRPIENVTFEEVKEILSKGNGILRVINSDLSIRSGQKGDYIFYKTSKMKKPVFYSIKPFLSETNEDYKICNINILKSWLLEKYDIKI
jgi:DNA topoisomerase-1